MAENEQPQNEAEGNREAQAAAGSLNVQIRAVGERYKAQWQYTLPPLFGDWLTQVPLQDQAELLLHLVRVDFALRTAAELEIRLDDYRPYGSQVVELVNRLQQERSSQREREVGEVCAQCGNPLISEEGNQSLVCPVCFQPSMAGASNLFSAADTVEATIQEASQLRNDNRFDLLKVIGEGAFGIVYKAYDTKLQRTVAVKKPKHTIEGTALLAREARAASKLRHSGIVRIFDVVETRKQIFVVSDFIDGKTLSKYRVQKKLSIDDVCQLMLKLSDAMKHAHENGVVHRDLKPSNIVVDADHQPHILDFGLSRSRFDSEVVLWRPGSPLGTPAFMPPEQAAGKLDDIGPQSDVYALGIVFYQLLTNHLPFSGSLEEILHGVENESPESTRVFNKSISPALDAVVQKCIAKSPSDRYANAGELADDIRAFLGDRRLVAYPKTDRRIVRRWTRVAALPVALIVMLLIAALFNYGWRLEVQKNNPMIHVMQMASPEIAQLKWYRWSEESGYFASDGRITEPGEWIDIAPGFYRVGITTKKGNLWEVYRTVPRSGQLSLMYPGVELKHAYWEFDNSDQSVTLPSIDYVAAKPDSDSLTIPSGNVFIPVTAPVPGSYGGDRDSILVVGHEHIVATAKISQHEYSVSDLKELYPGATLDRVTLHFALAYCEKVGACLPSISDYLMVQQQQLPLKQVRSGLKEWTSSRKPEEKYKVFDKIQRLSAPTADKYIVVQSADMDQTLMTETTRLSSNWALLPVDAWGDGSNDYGFRLKWIIKGSGD